MLFSFVASVIFSVVAQQAGAKESAGELRLEPMIEWRADGGELGLEPVIASQAEGQQPGPAPAPQGGPVERDRRMLRERSRMMEQEAMMQGRAQQPQREREMRPGDGPKPPMMERRDDGPSRERIERLRELMHEVRAMMIEVRELQREFAGAGRGHQGGPGGPGGPARGPQPEGGQPSGQRPGMQPSPPMPPAPPRMQERRVDAPDARERDEAREWSDRTGFLNRIAKDMSNPMTGAMLGLAMTRENMQPEQRVRVLNAVLEQVAEPLVVRNTARLILIETLREMGQNDRAAELVMQMITENAKAAK